MAKRRFEQQEDEELWLISYADMMTLVACFFILMMAFANFDPAGFQVKSEIIAKHFNKDKYKSSEIKLKYVQEELALHPNLKKMNKISLLDGGLTVIYQGSVLFEGQSAELGEALTATLDAMISTIRSLDPNYRVLIEGHTDNIPLPAGAAFTNNWALSAARAASVVERFEIGGFEPSKLTIIGHADTRPMASMMDGSGQPIVENQKMNRRVVIKVIESNKPKESVKLGLGVYFKDSTEPVEDLP
jgi:chemotaxis protein MotB